MTKKRWRDTTAHKPAATRELKASITVQKRGGGFFGIVDLGWLRALNDDATALDRLLADFKRTAPAGMGIEGETAVIGPHEGAEVAEAMAVEFLQMVCNVLEIPCDGRYHARTTGNATFADFSQHNRTDPRHTGAPPDDLPKRVDVAHWLADQWDATTLMLAAWDALSRKGDVHPTLLLSLARAVLDWRHTPPEQQTPLLVMERRMRALATMIAEQIGQGEEFVLLLCNQGEGGALTHIGTMDRGMIVKLVGEYVEHVRQDHQRYA